MDLNDPLNLSPNGYFLGSFDNNSDGVHVGGNLGVDNTNNPFAFDGDDVEDDGDIANQEFQMCAPSRNQHCPMFSLQLNSNKMTMLWLNPGWTKLMMRMQTRWSWTKSPHPLP